MPIYLPSVETLERALSLLLKGELVAIPTETVYGLAADATNDKAVAKIYSLKKRPVFNPLILHFADKETIKMYVHWNPEADKLSEAFWPGPLTLILPKRKDSPISLLATAGLNTVGVRIPHHKETLALLKLLRGPLAAPSANPSESISPTSALDVQKAFDSNESLLIIDGGKCTGGLESTILDLSQEVPTVLRPGLIPVEKLSEVLKRNVYYNNMAPSLLKAPGQMNRHYAPQLPLKLDAKKVSSTEALLAFGPFPLPGAATTLNLSKSGNLEEAASNLFRMLRELDQPHFSCISVMSIPSYGIGMAINDRLYRASSPTGD
jgi:L-threonylcarbamoyladenylate synthase